jgi:hypothetical protein
MKPQGRKRGAVAPAWVPLAIALCSGAIAAAGCSLPRGTLGRGPARDGGALRLDGGSFDAGPRRDGGPPTDSSIVRPDAAGECTLTTECPARIDGAWSDCAFPDACSELGSESRTSTVYACESGACVAHDEPESQACTRSTAGAPCGEGTCDECVASGGGGMGCDMPATGSQSCTTMTCESGVCTPRVEARACDPPGPDYCDTPGPWGDCDRDLFTWGCERGRTRATCFLGTCSGFAWESEPCTGC